MPPCVLRTAGCVVLERGGRFAVFPGVVRCLAFSERCGNGRLHRTGGIEGFIAAWLQGERFPRRLDGLQPCGAEVRLGGCGLVRLGAADGRNPGQEEHRDDVSRGFHEFLSFNRPRQAVERCLLQGQGDRQC
jgi:hypothetical protein